jgi:hypothetical protein
MFLANVAWHHSWQEKCPLTPDKKERMRVVPYALAIGSIMYAMLCTCPDVSFALSATSWYQSNYGEAHWIIVKYVLNYLRKTKEVFLVFGGEEEIVVMGYTDATLQIDADDSEGPNRQ